MPSGGLRPSRTWPGIVRERRACVGCAFHEREPSEGHADGQVRFVVFAPDPRYVDRVQRVSGVVSRVDLMRAVEPYEVHRWAADAGI